MTPEAHARLRVIVEAADGPLSALDSTQRIAALARVVSRALATGGAATEVLWESSIEKLLRDTMLLQHRVCTHYKIYRRGYEHALRDLPEPLRRAFLVAYCPQLGLDKLARALIDNYVRLWLGSLPFEYHLRLFREWRDDRYPLGYRSPRERELLSIVDDDSRSKRDRFDAADQLALIEEKRREDEDGKHERLDDGFVFVQLRPTAGRSKSVWGRPCKEHRIRGCSRCQPRRPGSSALPARYETLAHESGWDPQELKAPSRQGRAPGQAERLDKLGQVVSQLSQEGFTYEQIGSVIGRPRQRVSDLHKRAV